MFVSLDLENKGFMVRWARINAILFVFLCFCIIFSFSLFLKIAEFALKSLFLFLKDLYEPCCKLVKWLQNYIKSMVTLAHA